MLSDEEDLQTHLILLATAVVLFLIIKVLGPSNNEPAFAGKPVSYYVAQLQAADDGISNDRRWKRIQEATNALHRMGPDGIAWLASHLENTNPPSRLERFTAALPNKVRLMLPIPPSQPPGDVLNRHILSALVNSGDLAVPVLTNYLDSSRYDPIVRQQIYNSLGYPPLSFAARPAIPILQANARGTNDMDRVLASYALAQIAPEHAAEAVDTLIAVLEKKNSPNRVSAANLLKNLDKAAQPAVPALERAWRDPDPALQREARHALQRITGQSYPLWPTQTNTPPSGQN